MIGAWKVRIEEDIGERVIAAALSHPLSILYCCLCNPMLASHCVLGDSQNILLIVFLFIIMIEPAIEPVSITINGLILSRTSTVLDWTETYCLDSLPRTILNNLRIMIGPLMVLLRAPCLLVLPPVNELIKITIEMSFNLYIEVKPIPMRNRKAAQDEWEKIDSRIRSFL